MAKMTFFAIFIAALGGFLFGYNTSVIAGALVFLKAEFDLSVFKEGFIVSSLLIGALFGAIVGGSLADRWGRRAALLVTALIFVVGVVLTMNAQGVGLLLWGRIVTGFAVGLASVVSPLYLAEISLPQYRGAVVTIYQLAITLGILAAYLVDFFFAHRGSWRMMFAVGMIPALFQLLAFRFFPESPRWLDMKGKVSDGKKSFSKRLRFILVIGVLLSILQQVTGINTVIYYAPQIFHLAGFSSINVSLLATVGIGVINVLSTLLSVWLMDRVGRRKLLITGLIGMSLSLGVLSLAFLMQSKAIDLVALISLMSYVAFFAFSLGPVTWVVISEIYPLKIRGRAMSIAVCANWIFNYLVSLTFLDFVTLLGSAGVFFLYAAIGVLGLWFVYRFIPETKGKRLEDIEKLFN